MPCPAAVVRKAQREAERRVVGYLAFTTPPTVEDPVPLHESLP